MNFSDILSFAKNPQNYVNQQQNQQGQTNLSQNDNNPNNPQSRNASNDPQNQSGQQGQQRQQQQQEQDPFELYATLFEQKDPTKAPTPPSFSVSDDVLNKVAGSIDFMHGMPQELQEKLQSGEPLDNQTVMSLISHATKNAYMSSVRHLSGLTDKFVNSRSEFDKQGLPSQLQKLLATNSISKVPGAENPVVKNFLSMTSSALSEKYPDQSPEWIADKTKGLFLQLAKAVQPENSDQASNEGLVGKNDFDWDNYLTPKEAA